MARRCVYPGPTSILLAVLRVVVISCASFASAEDAAPAANAAAAWLPGDTVRLKTFDVVLSRPVNVYRSKGHVWFPCLHRHTNGDILAYATDYPDSYQSPTTCLASWSSDGGLNWSAPFQTGYGDILFTTPTGRGDVIQLPYYLYHRPGGVGNSYRVIDHGSRTIRQEEDGLVITGWPRPDRRDSKIRDLAGFRFNGDAVRLEDGAVIATLHGHFQGAPRNTLAVVRSTDGVKWTYHGTVADADCPLEGGDGPSEASLCRLPDRRLMAVFRTASYVPYGQAFSRDEGKTWGGVRRMDGPGSVQPSLVALKSGVVTLSAGRPGIFLWINAAGDGLSWEQVDLLANHNRGLPEDFIHESRNISATTPFHHARHETSSYTQTIALDDNTLLIVYDRGPRGGEKIEDIAPETNSLWVVRAEIRPR